MIRFAAVVAQFPELPPPELTDWIARGWVQPEGATDAEWVFSDIDVARVRLIFELRIRMEVDEDALPLVLSLLDQIYGLRGTVQAMVRALDSQSPEVRAAVLAALGSGR
jgi:chaperone modulatory protein CbpM